MNFILHGPRRLFWKFWGPSKKICGNFGSIVSRDQTYLFFLSDSWKNLNKISRNLSKEFNVWKIVGSRLKFYRKLSSREKRFAKSGSIEYQSLNSPFKGFTKLFLCWKGLKLEFLKSKNFEIKLLKKSLQNINYEIDSSF
jgi:hypothetical protein